MKKLILMLGFLSVIISAQFCITAHASTSGALNESILGYYNYQQYAGNYEAPYSKEQQNNISVNEMTGGLSLSETDISLPGKNGMDVNITRMYSNQDTGYNVITNSNTSTQNTYYGYLYKAGTRYMFVYFDEEEYMDGVPESFKAVSEVSGYLWPENKVEQYGKSVAISYDMLKRIKSNNFGTVTYQKCSDNKEVFTKISSYKLQDSGELKLGNGFKLAWPRIVFDENRIDGTFENENGEVFSFDLGRLTFDPETNQYYAKYCGATGSQYTMYRHKVDKFVGERTYKGIVYTTRIKDIDGKTYYFYQAGDSQIANIRLIEDTYGNTIKYDYDSSGNITITDTYGRKINITKNVLGTINGNDYAEPYTSLETRVSVQNGSEKQEVIYKTYVESDNDNKVFDDKYIFEVRKKELYNNASADNSSYVTKYEMSRKQTTIHKYYSGGDRYLVNDSITYKDTPSLEVKGKDIYNIDKIIYPTNACSVFEYSDDVKIHEYNSDSYFTNTFKVLSSKDVLRDGTVRNAYTYAYDSQADFSSCEVYTETENTSMIKDSANTVRTVDYTGENNSYKTKIHTQTKDSSGQIIDDVDYVLKSSGVKFNNNINSYSNGNTDYITNKIDEYHMKEWGNLLLYIQNGNYRADYEYALTKPDDELASAGLNGYIGLRGIVSKIPEVTTYKKDADTTIKIVNKFGTADGTEKEKTIKYFADGTISEEYYEDQNLYLVKTSIYENDVEKSQIKYKYNQYGDVIQERIKINDTGDEILNVYTYDYGSNGELTVKSTVCDVEGVLLGDEEPAGQFHNIETVQKYDFLGNLIYEKDGNGQEWNYTYDMFGRVTKAIDPLDNYTNYFYDLKNNEVWIYDAEEKHKTYGYDGLGNLRYVWGGDEENDRNLAQFEYDGLSRLIKETEYLTGTSCNTAEYTYDAKGRILSSVLTGTSEEGKEYNKYTYSYNDYDPDAEDENVRTVTKTPSNTNYAVTKEYYEINTGNLLREKMLTGSNTLLYGAEYTYDYVGNALTLKQGKDYGTSAYTAQMTYDHNNRILTQTNADGQTLVSTYDMAGRLISNTNYAGDKTRYFYNTLGQVIVKYLPFENNTRVISKTYYDGNGNVVRTENENWEPGDSSRISVVKNIYNADNTLQKTISEDANNSQETAYEYYTNGLIKKLIVAPNSDNPEITAYEYNLLNQLVKTTDPMGNVSTVNPDRAGNIISAVDRNGTATNYTYNALGSILTVSASNGDAQETVSYTYDSMGNVTAMNDNTGTTNYSYDSMSRLINETKGGVVKEYTYTTNGNVETFKLKSNGSTLQNAEFEYDNLNRLTSVQDKVNSAMKTSYTYNVNGQLASEKRGNNKVSATYTYNKAGLLTNMTDGSMTYEYDHYADGNIKTIKENGALITSYTYDGAGRLYSEITRGEMVIYAYDEYGNRKSLTHTGTENYTVDYTYDMNNRLLSESKTQGSEISTANYTYDKNGNQLKKVKSVYVPNSEESSGMKIMTPGVQNSYYESYEYNLFGKLTKAAKNGKITLYTYDGNGERQSKTVNGTETKEVWSGGNIVAEINESGEVAANYYYGIRLYGAKTEGKDVYYSYNGHGDTTGLTDTSGNVAASYEYDAFGNVLEESGIYNPFRYNGQYTDDETGLIYLRNRYYDPEIGRFTQEDPVRDGVNWYTYCYNNPILFTDPWGLEYLVVSGSEYDGIPGINSRYKYNFIETAITKIKELKALNDGEWITWIVSSTGYTTESLNLMNDIAYSLGVGFQTIDSAAELQNYINSQSINTWELSEKRLNDPIRKFVVFAHGVPGRVELGHNFPNNSDLCIDFDFIQGMFSEAFDNPNSAFYSCRAGTNTTSQWGSNTAQDWVNRVGGRTWASTTRTDYAHIIDGEGELGVYNREKYGFNINGSPNYPVASGGINAWNNYYRPDWFIVY